MKYYLAIDIGASSGRHIVGYMKDGELVTDELYRFPNGMDTVDGHLVWDTERLLREVKAGIAECFKNVETNSGHYKHIENYVNRIGKLNTVFRKIRSDYRHRIRNYVHGLILVGSLVKLRKLGIALLGVHPVVDITCVLFL